ncbi:hypothetical protein V1291_004790 [Nitrobacteraceae bacterium AZCC 1564]
MNHHRALGYCLSMIFSENRCTLFRIMLSAGLLLLFDSRRPSLGSSEQSRAYDLRAAKWSASLSSVW